ncbi:hypothetical protein D0Y65_007129 [Glycine soja]|nr:hypothetical protein D0Y65_007129 [Glycine soja]
MMQSVQSSTRALFTTLQSPTAIKLGSASWFDFKHFVFDNIAIVDSHRGIGFQIRDGERIVKKFEIHQHGHHLQKVHQLCWWVIGLYRPGCQELIKHRTAGMMMEHIEGLEVKKVEMRWSNSQLEQWNNPLEFRPSTVNNISFLNFNSGSYTNSKSSYKLWVCKGRMSKSLAACLTIKGTGEQFKRREEHLFCTIKKLERERSIVKSCSSASLSASVI